MSNNNVAKALGWKLLERFGVLGGQFVLQIVLARLLDPEHYGVLSLMLIFTALADVFIHRGFNSSLIQNKDVKEADYSSVFWVTMGVATVLYAIFFAAAPAIAKFYKMPDLVAPFRVLCLMLFPGAFNSVQLAIISRRLDFKKVFYSNVAAILVSGTAGIALALAGAGLWALVAQTLLNTAVVSVVMLFTVRWTPKFFVDFARVKVLFAYGWKLMVSSLLDTLYTDLSSLVIGKKYDSGMLGYYNRGKQFPQFIIGAVNSAVQTVLLPAMSAEQDDKEKVKSLMRNSVMLSSYVVFPMMAGLAGVAVPLVSLLLTDKWLPSVPYMQIFCFSMAFYPVHSSNLQAINAMGRSDIFLKLEIIKKSIGAVVLAIAVFCFESPLAIAATGAVTAISSSFINACPNKKLIGYSYLEQVRDILPSFVASLLMMGCVLAVQLLHLPNLVMLLVQMITGVVAYLALSAIGRIKPYTILTAKLKGMLGKYRS